jgi:CubicO group peptidase (beta-lactamase class C family)
MLVEHPAMSTPMKTALGCVALLLLIAPCVSRAFDASAANTCLAGLAREQEFSGAVLIATNGSVVFDRAYGVANREYDAANTTNTIFLLASVTKQFTAMGILRLQEQGKLNVTNLISQYVEDCPAAWRGITLHHLLTHTSGITNFTEFKDHPDPFEILPSTAAGTIAMFKNKPLDFEPGTKMHYSNSGYVLLTYIIEKVSGLPYDRFIAENIFRPLGMKHSGFYRPSEILPGVASGYSRQDSRIMNCFPPPTEMLQGAGGLYSTVGDMFAWDEALTLHRLVRAQTQEKMFTPFKNDFGYGWFRGRVAGHMAFLHGGSVSGFGCRVARFPDERVYIVVLSNFDWVKPDRIVNELGGIVFRPDAKN